MYKLITLVSTLIRQFLLPNPFEQLPTVVSISLLGATIKIPPIFLNVMVEPLIHAATFATVDLYYNKNVNSPAKGSFLYLFFYCIHIFLLSIMARFEFTKLVILLIIGGYFILHIGFIIIKSARFD